MPSTKEAMVAKFGEESVKGAMSRAEVLDLVDVLKEAVLELKGRINALETHGVKYAGTFQRALAYRRGHVVTADGSMWIALRDTTEGEAPGKALDAWQLAGKGKEKRK